MTKIRLALVAVVLTFGVSSFMPAYGCGGFGTSGCRKVTPPPIWLSLVRAVVTAGDVLVP